MFAEVEILGKCYDLPKMGNLNGKCIEFYYWSNTIIQTQTKEGRAKGSLPSAIVR
jgi:hypothetical protein